MVHFDLPAGESRQVHFLLGQGANREESLALIKRYQDLTQVEQAWQQARGLWQDLLTTVQVETPEPAFDLLLNRWLLYQNLACRVWGRTAFYQSSGAYGFRDQLQDVLALIHARPDVARSQILRAAHHQFEAGDVLHWWHPPSGRGVRTRISDDLLWLPFVTAHYVLATGDRSIWDEQLPFLVGQPLDKSEHERYGKYDSTCQTYSLLEHCRKALKRGQTHGAHGLPLFGGGDWNDGMNRVGMNGKGESVWLGWFLIETLQRFADLCDLLEHTEEATQVRSSAEQLCQALDNSAWDGAWYTLLWLELHFLLSYKSAILTQPQYMCVATTTTALYLARHTIGSARSTQLPNRGRCCRPVGRSASAPNSRCDLCVSG